MDTATIEIGNRTFRGELTQISGPAEENPEPEQDTAPERFVFGAGNALYPEPRQGSIEFAIRESWAGFLQQYDEWKPAEGVDYPEFRGSSEGWPRSESKGALTIELPPGEVIIDEPLYLPANIPLKGSGGAFDGTTLRFRGAGRLIILGDLETPDMKPVKTTGKTIEGIYFVAEKSIGCVELWGTIQNLRIVNNHFNTLGQDMIVIRHERGVGGYEETPFGTCYSDPGGPHLKEVMIERSQFEFKYQAIKLIAPKRCRITDNAFIYGELAIGATEAGDLRISGNDFTGGCKCPAVVEVSIKEPRAHFMNNQLCDCEEGAWFIGMPSEGTADATNTRNGSFSARSMNVRTSGFRLPFEAGEFNLGARVG